MLAEGSTVINGHDGDSDIEAETALLGEGTDRGGVLGGDVQPGADDVTVCAQPQITIEESPPPQPSTFKHKLLVTCLIYWNMATLGMVYAQLGPTLPDLQLITNSSLSQVTWLFTGFGIGYIAGCLLAGIAQEKMSPRLLLSVCTICTGITVGVLPWIENIYVSVGVKIIQGVTLAGQDTVDIAMIFAIWRSESGPYNQLIYIVYSAGCILSPLYTKPFLRDVDAVSVQPEQVSPRSISLNRTNLELDIADTNVHFAYMITAALTVSAAFPFVLMNSVSVQPEQVSQRNISLNESTNGTDRGLDIADTNVHFAYMITAALTVSAAFPFIVMSACKVKEPVASATDLEEESKRVTLPAKLTYVILGLSFTTSLVANACTDMFPNLLTTFVIQQLDWSQQHASDLTAVFFAMYGVGNLIGMVVLKYSTTNKLIVVSYIGTVFSLIGCMLGSFFAESIVIWITIVLIGMSMAAIVPTIYTWIEENVTPVTSRIASGILLFSAVGIMIQPILLGYLMDKQSPMWFLNITLGGIVMCALCYIVSFSLVKRFVSKSNL